MGYKIFIGYCIRHGIKSCFYPKFEYIVYCLIKLGTYSLNKLSTSCIKWFKMEVTVWNQFQKLPVITIPTFDNNNLSLIKVQIGLK